jgi:hypothetical protein
MNKVAVVTGSPKHVASVCRAFVANGTEALSLADLSPGTGPIDCYVQLGVTVPARGETVVRRAHAFLNDGLLERFRAAERLMPLLADDATVLLVAGNLPAEVADPDDRKARLALLRVLAHAMRADLAPSQVRVRVVTGERSDEEIVAYALSGAKDPLADLAAEHGAVIGKTYEDWRIAVMGLVHVQT